MKGVEQNFVMKFVQGLKWVMKIVFRHFIKPDGLVMHKAPLTSLLNFILVIKMAVQNVNFAALL